MNPAKSTVNVSAKTFFRKLKTEWARCEKKREETVCRSLFLCCSAVSDRSPLAEPRGGKTSQQQEKACVCLCVRQREKKPQIGMIVSHKKSKQELTYTEHWHCSSRRRGPASERRGSPCAACMPHDWWHHRADGGPFPEPPYSQTCYPSPSSASSQILLSYLCPALLALINTPATAI